MRGCWISVASGEGMGVWGDPWNDRESCPLPKHTRMWQIWWWVACGGWRDLAPSFVALGAAVIVFWGPTWFGGKREDAGKEWMVGIVEVALEIEDHRAFLFLWAPCEPSRCSSNPRKGEQSLKPQLKLNFYQGIPWDPDLIGLEEITSCPWHSTCTNCGANVYPLQIKPGQDPQGAHIWGSSLAWGGLIRQSGVGAKNHTERGWVEMGDLLEITYYCPLAKIFQ